MKASVLDVLVAGALLSMMGAPALLEHCAERAAIERLSRCPDGTHGCGAAEGIDVELFGLRLEEAWIRRRGWIAGGRSIRVGIGGSGVQIEIDDPVVRAAPPVGDAAPTVEQPATDPSRGRALPKVPVTIETRGDLVVPDTLVGTITARNLRARWRAGDPVTLSAEGSLEHPRGRVETVGPMRAQLWLDGSARVSASGALSLGGGPATAVTATMRERAVHLTLDDGSGGALELEVDPRGGRLSGSAQAFALAHLGSTLPSRPGIELGDTMLDGAFELERSPSHHLRAHLQTLTLTGLRIDHPKLSRVPVVFDALTVTGDVAANPDEQQAQLMVAHRGAQVHVSGTRTRERIDLHAELPTVACQDLLDALPEGITGVVAGARVSGDVDARLSFSLAFDALTIARRSAEPDPDRPPGTLALSFEPLRRCTISGDPPQVDLAALRGPYRHRFVDDRGHPHERIMAAGAPHYVSLSSVPRLARAFMALEDTRFLQHDGFDRDQIERALWHNLVVGRVSRGASTITQQLARSLWLGIDRSLARKLQEALLAHRLEQTVDKKRILELYLNVIELGPGVFGVSEAAEYYFGKPAAALEMVEALHVASMAPAPHTLARRFASGEVDDAWMEQLHQHLRRLQLFGHIGHDELLRSLRAPLRLRVHEPEGA